MARNEIRFCGVNTPSAECDASVFCLKEHTCTWFILCILCFAIFVLKVMNWPFIALQNIQSQFFSIEISRFAQKRSHSVIWLEWLLPTGKQNNPSLGFLGSFLPREQKRNGNSFLNLGKIEREFIRLYSKMLDQTGAGSNTLMNNKSSVVF